MLQRPQRRVVLSFTFLCVILLQTGQDFLDGMEGHDFFIGNERRVTSLLLRFVSTILRRWYLSFPCNWGGEMFHYHRPKSWCPFLICTNYTVSGGFGFSYLFANPLFYFSFCSWRQSRESYDAWEGWRDTGMGGLWGYVSPRRFWIWSGQSVFQVSLLTIIGLWTELQRERIRTGAALACAVCQSGNKDDVFDCFCAMREGNCFSLIWLSKHVISSCVLMLCFVLILLLISVIRNCLWSGMKQCFRSLLRHAARPNWQVRIFDAKNSNRVSEFAYLMNQTCLYSSHAFNHIVSPEMSMLYWFWLIVIR